MSIDFYWRIGMEGDHASLRTPRRYNRGDAGGYGPGNIAPAIRNGELDGYGYIDHMAAVAKASESAGFLGGLLPSFPMTDDPWATAAALAAETTTYRFMVAFQPGFLHPCKRRGCRRACSGPPVGDWSTTSSAAVAAPRNCGGVTRSITTTATPGRRSSSTCSGACGTDVRAISTAASSARKAPPCHPASPANRFPRCTSPVPPAPRWLPRTARGLLPLLARAVRRPAIQVRRCA